MDMKDRLPLTLSSVELKPKLPIGLFLGNLSNEREQANQLIIR
jgi:hypothetical protein